MILCEIQKKYKKKQALEQVTAFVRIIKEVHLMLGVCIY